MNWLSFKISAGISGAVFPVFLVILGIMAPVNWGLALLAAVIIGGISYGICYHLLAGRIELARRTLKETRKRRFDNLEDLAIKRGDELDALTWQVYRMGNTLRKEIDRLKQMENYRREYLGNVSHELKTPIFAVRGFTETLLEGALEDEAVNRKFLVKILRNADRLNNLVQDLSIISRIEIGELEMIYAPFDMITLLNEVAESLDPLAEKHAVTIQLSMPKAPLMVNGDQLRIQQVLSNLMDNAIKYNNPGGRVELAVRRTKSQAKITVADNGIGIPAEDIPRLTERFYRVDKSRSREQGGTGLGMAIVKHILEAHEQKLYIESTEGQGATFAFTLNLAEN